MQDITDLRQAAVMVQESSTEKRLDDLRSSVVQTVSHELRTPMTTIVTSMELLKRYSAAANEVKQTYIDRVQQAVWRMSALLNDVLLYDEVDSGRRPFSPTQLNLESFCQDVVRKLQSVEGDRPIIVDSHDACNAVSLEGELVQQMLDRLLSNALRYSPSATTVRVAVRCDGYRISVHNEALFLRSSRHICLNRSVDQRL